MTLLSPDIIMALAQRFVPVLLFDPSEHFFPIDAEEFLGHSSSESWHAATSHQRGSSIIRLDPDELASLAGGATQIQPSNIVIGHEALAGAPQQINLTTPTDPGYVGQRTLARPPTGELFLDFGGWDDTPGLVRASDPKYTRGSSEYDEDAFSALGSTVNKPAVMLVEPNASFSVPQLEKPTIYVEIEWAGHYPRIDLQRSLRDRTMRDFAQQLSTDPASHFTDLDNYIVLTYYFFYPKMAPASTLSDPSALQSREGQWEAVSIYLSGVTDPTPGTDPFVRPAFKPRLQKLARRPDGNYQPAPGDPGDPHYRFNEGGSVVIPIGPPDASLIENTDLVPRYVVYSQGYEARQDQDPATPLYSEVRPWFDPLGRMRLRVRKVNDFHPIVYVSAGTHHDLFNQIAALTTTSVPSPGLQAVGNIIMVAGAYLAGICGIGTIVTGPHGVVVACVIVAGIIIVIGAVLYLLSFLFQVSSTSESPLPSGPQQQLARDGGPAALLGDGFSLSSDGAFPQPTMTGMNLRYISRFDLGATPVHTGLPPDDSVFEAPAWLYYAGRWGIITVNSAAGTWDSGSRFTDGNGRTRAYWNTYQLVKFLADPMRAGDHGDHLLPDDGDA